MPFLVVHKATTYKKLKEKVERRARKERLQQTIR
jgi:hypothetical protein